MIDFLYKSFVKLAFERYSSELVQTVLQGFFPNLKEVRKQIILKILDKRTFIGVKVINEAEKFNRLTALFSGKNRGELRFEDIISKPPADVPVLNIVKEKL